MQTFFEFLEHTQPTQAYIVAPIVKKSSSGLAAKSGTGKSAQVGKNPGGKMTASLGPTKITSSKPSSGSVPNKITVGTSGTSGKNYTPMSYSTPTNKKSTTFGVIWLPSRKHNKKKEIIYNSHRNDRYKERGPSMFNFMSGDSHNSDKKEEDSEKDLLVPDRLPVAIAGASATAAIVEPAVVTNQPEEKQELINKARDKEETQDASGDSPKIKKGDSDCLEHNESIDNSVDSKWEKDKGDNVDSVYLRPPPPHKARSNTSSPAEEEEDCGIKCLYYTLQCCDCVLM